MSSKQPAMKTIVPGSRTLEEIYEDEAHQIVDEAIDNAMRRLMARFENDAQTFDQMKPEDMAEDEGQIVIDQETGKPIPNIKWMSADNFTVAGGLEKVEEFIQVGRNKIPSSYFDSQQLVIFYLVLVLVSLIIAHALLATFNVAHTEHMSTHPALIT